MKILALGGCGDMGRVAARTCIEYDFVTKITVADRDFDGALLLSEQLGEKAGACKIDITDAGALASLLSEHDVVIATVGPYYRFGTMVLKAAINAKCHYIDICDDWEPTLEMLNMHADAQKAGVTALLGVGASPGVANLLAVKAMNELDVVEDVYTTFGATSRNEEMEGDDEGSAEAAALEHWVYQFTGSIRAHIAGQSKITTPLQRMVLDYPTFGKIVSYSLGHPEPVTLPIYFPQVRNSATLMVLPNFIISVLKELQQDVDAKKLTIEQAMERIYSFMAEDGTSRISPSDVLRYIYHTCVEILQRKNYLPTITAFASGVKGGRSTRVAAYLNGAIGGGMGPETCIPTSVALSMLAAGEITKAGVFAPEGCIDPDLFFDRLYPYYTRVDDPQYGPVRISLAN